jgi:uncharacterized Tic20 family protein
MKAGVRIAVASVITGWVLPISVLIGVEIADHFRSAKSDNVGFGVAAFGLAVLTCMLSSIAMLAATVSLARTEPSKMTRTFFRLGMCGVLLFVAFLVAMLYKSYA